MPKEPVKLSIQHTRAVLVESTINEKERTVEVTYGTDNPVPAYNWQIGDYSEILSFKDGHIRMDRLNSGAAPVLDNHDKGEQIGVIEKAWTEGNTGRALLRFSKNPDADLIWKDIVDRIRKNISVGYWVYAYNDLTAPDSDKLVYEATDWEPYEISTVTVPADIKSGVRAENGIEKEVKILNTRKMPDPIVPPTPDPKAPVVDPKTPVIPAVTEEQTRAIADAERLRSKGIISAVRSARLPIEFAEKLIENPAMTIDAARAAIIEEFSKQDPNKGLAVVAVTGLDERDKKRAAMTEALEHRVNPTIKLEAGREFRGMSLMEMARESLEQIGIKTRGLGRKEICDLSLGLKREAGMMTTSDFPLILGNVFHKRLRAAYDLNPRTFTPWTSQSSAQDFRDMNRIQTGDISSFEEVKEGGEYKAGSFGEAQEKYRVKKYGKIVPISWETLINDDLNAFSRIPAMIAATAAQMQSDIVYGIVTDNAALADSVALFHSTHKNLAGTGTAIDVVSLAAARAAMRKQKSLGSKFLNLQPAFLIVGPDSELVAAQFTSQNYVATENSKINPGFNSSLKVIIEPRLTGNQWYLAAAPGAIDTIEYAFLEGEGELFTETRQAFETDAFEIKARMVFGAKALDFRGLYKNAGA